MVSAHRISPWCGICRCILDVPILEEDIFQLFRALTSRSYTQTHIHAGLFFAFGIVRYFFGKCIVYVGQSIESRAFQLDWKRKHLIDPRATTTTTNKRRTNQYALNYDNSQIQHELSLLWFFLARCISTL